LGGGLPTHKGGNTAPAGFPVSNNRDFVIKRTIAMTNSTKEWLLRLTDIHIKNLVPLLLLIAITGCHRKYLNHKSRTPETLSTNRIDPATVDTFKKGTYVTSNVFKEFSFYETGRDTLQFLSKYFVKELCSPGDFHHPRYLAFQKKSSGLIPEVKKRLKTILTNSDHSTTGENCPAIGPFMKKLGKVEHLNNCLFHPIPYYHLTFNVAERKGTDTNFLQFFNLDTMSVYFKVELLHEIIGIIKYSNNGALKVACFYPQDSLAITKIDALKKDAILIKEDLVNPGSSYQSFGFTNNNTLFFGQCYFEELVQRNENTQETRNVNKQGCEFIPSQEFYLKPTSIGNNLGRIIKDGFISKSSIVQ